jgi:peptide/nickel transport system permease protein
VSAATAGVGWTLLRRARQEAQRWWHVSPRACVGLAIFGSIALLALMAPVIAPYSTSAQDPSAALQGPSLNHFFGTDEFGRDVFSRVLYGGRSTIAIAGSTVVLALLIGFPLGLIAGFFGGWRDLAIMRIVEFGFSIPALVLAIAVIAFLGTGVANVVVALTIVYAPLLARVTRAATLSIRRRPFILAAEAVGERLLPILVRQVTPNITAPVLTQATLVFAYSILAEASLSFLELGTDEPRPSWGRQLRSALSLVNIAPWIGIFPGICIALTVIGLNLFGDGLRDVLDPRTQSSHGEGGPKANVSEVNRGWR